MREVTKSLGSLSYALSLFGARQALQLLTRPIPTGDHPTVREMDVVARAAEGQLGRGLFQRAFVAGDRVQRSVVDLAWGVVTLQALDPSRLLSLSSEVVRQSTAAVRDVLPGGGCGCSSPSEGAQPCGWGPMPPPR